MSFMLKVLLLFLKNQFYSLLSPGPHSYPAGLGRRRFWSNRSPHPRSSHTSASQLSTSSSFCTTHTVVRMLMFLTSADENQSSKSMLSLMENSQMSCNLGNYTDYLTELHPCAGGTIISPVSPVSNWYSERLRLV